MKKLILSIFCFLFIAGSSLNAEMIIGTGISADWSTITQFITWEGEWSSPTYTLAAGVDYGTDPTGTSGGGSPDPESTAKIGSNGLQSNATDDDIMFDADDFSDSEGRIGAWVRVDTTWSDLKSWWVIWGSGSDNLNLFTESTGTNEISAKWEDATNGDQLCNSSGTTLSLGTWYFIEVAWKTSTNYLEIFISTDGNEDFYTNSCSVTLSDWTTPAGTDDIHLGCDAASATEVMYIDNFILSSSSTKNLYDLRNETAHP